MKSQKIMINFLPNSTTVVRFTVNEDVLGSNPSQADGTMAEWSKAEVY